MRLIDDMVTFFRMEMSAEQIKAVCDDGVISDPTLQLCAAGSFFFFFTPSLSFLIMWFAFYVFITG